MKVVLTELEIAIQYMKNNCKDLSVDVSMLDGRNLNIKFLDKYDTITEITIFGVHSQDQSAMLPQIRKTDTLTKDLANKSGVSR